VTQLVCILVSFLVYFPFVRVASRRADRAEIAAGGTGAVETQ